MKAIWKFELRAEKDQDVTLPSDHKFISVISKNNRITLYAVVDPVSQPTKKRVRVIPTGLRFENDYLHKFDFLGTVMTENRPLVMGIPTYTFVWHIYVERMWT